MRRGYSEVLQPLPVLNYNRSHPSSPVWGDPARMTRLAIDTNVISIVMFSHSGTEITKKT